MHVRSHVILILLVALLGALALTGWGTRDGGRSGNYALYILAGF